jgi:tRNA (guanine-N(7)-)-methyltransferase subunit TRM82
LIPFLHFRFVFVFVFFNILGHVWHTGLNHADDVDNLDPNAKRSTRFVSAIHIPPTSPTHLISGGGDPILKLWNWHAGTLLLNLPILEVVKPYVVVLPEREKKPVTRKDGKPAGRKGRKKARLAAEAAEAGNSSSHPGGEAEAEADAAMSVDVIPTPVPASEPVLASATGAGATSGHDVEVTNQSPGQEPVLVIQKISTFTTPSGETQIVFCATGYVNYLFLYDTSPGPMPTYIHAELRPSSPCHSHLRTPRLRLQHLPMSK